MRRLRLLAALLLGAALVPASSGAAPAQPTATLVDVRATHHPTFDRIVFRFRGGFPATSLVHYVDRLVADASGRTLPVAGQAILQVRFDGADAHDADGPTVPARRAYALPNVMTVVRAGDFEAVTTYGIGLAKETKYRVFAHSAPDRIVVEVGAAFKTVRRDVYFIDVDRFEANTRPFFTSVPRPVRVGAQAKDLVDRIFAGPLPGERSRGMRLLRSGARGYSDLSVRGGIARVQLTGRCSSGGSTVTIAGSIVPTLRQLRSVDWVKIYDRHGRTATPTGHVDSNPECLEP